MGRTLPTYRNLLEEEISRWNDFRRALDRRDQEVFDELMTWCRRHASAAGYQASVYPYEAMVLSILVEMAKKLDREGGR